MRITVKMAILAATGLALPAAAEEAVKRLTVVVYDRSVAAGQVLGRAQATAGKMFAGIGVRIEWRNETLKRLRAMKVEQPVVVTITERTPPDFHPGAFAVAQPYEATHVRILYDRMAWATSWPNLAPMLLAQVMAHEIAHVLQGISRHSTAGVMKPHLTLDDFVTLKWKPLAFEAYDVMLIHDGLTARTSPALAVSAGSGQ